jgi:large subunit ribosomal protein L9
VRDIVEALEADGHKIAKSQVVLDKPIKAIGVHEVKVALHPEVAVTIKVNVARSPEEAEMQASGVDVMAQMLEEGRDVAGFTEDYNATEDAAAVLGEEPAAEAIEEAEADESAEG